MLIYKLVRHQPNNISYGIHANVMYFSFLKYIHKRVMLHAYPEILIRFLNFEMGLLGKILIYTSQPRIGALRCTIAQRMLWKRFLVSSYMWYAPYWKNVPLTPQSPIQGSPFVETPIPLDTPSPMPMPISDYLKTLPRSQNCMLSDVEQIATKIQVLRAFRSREQLFNSFWRWFIWNPRHLWMGFNYIQTCPFSVRWTCWWSVWCLKFYSERTLRFRVVPFDDCRHLTQLGLTS